MKSVPVLIGSARLIDRNTPQGETYYLDSSNGNVLNLEFCSSIIRPVSGSFCGTCHAAGGEGSRVIGTDWTGSIQEY
jgi:hypothetical protein